MFAIQDGAIGVIVLSPADRPREQQERLDTALTAEEMKYLHLAAEAFAVGELLKTDHPLTPVLVRKGVLRTSGRYALITDLGVTILRERGHQGPLPVSRAKVLGLRGRVGA